MLKISSADLNDHVYAVVNNDLVITGYMFINDDIKSSLSTTVYPTPLAALLAGIKNGKIKMELDKTD